MCHHVPGRSKAARSNIGEHFLQHLAENVTLFRYDLHFSAMLHISPVYAILYLCTVS